MDVGELKEALAKLPDDMAVSSQIENCIALGKAMRDLVAIVEGRWGNYDERQALVTSCEAELNKINRVSTE